MAEPQPSTTLFLVSTISTDTVVFLLEVEPGLVEFPRLLLSAGDMDDEAVLVQRIKEQTGMDVAISGFLDAPAENGSTPAGKLLLARHLGGSPNFTLEHVGWEWTTGARLMALPFAPKMMLDELKAFMDT